MSDEKWWSMNITFEAASMDEAIECWQRTMDAFCEGDGHGDDHVCPRQFASGMHPTDTETGDDLPAIARRESIPVLLNGTAWTASWIDPPVLTTHTG